MSDAPRGKKPRSTFANFHVYFRAALKQQCGGPFDTETDKELCLAYDGLRHAQKTAVLESIARAMGVKKGQAQKHYSNSFSRAKYPKTSENAKKVVQMFMHHYMQQQACGKPLSAVCQFLLSRGIRLFPGSIHAIASKAKTEIERGRYLGPRYDAEEMRRRVAAVLAEPAVEAPETPADHPPTPVGSSFSGPCDAYAPPADVPGFAVEEDDTGYGQLGLLDFDEPFL